MKSFEIEIRVVSSDVYTIDAETLDEAIDIAQAGYDSGELVVETFNDIEIYEV